jgi:hypothetical protein
MCQRNCVFNIIVPSLSNSRRQGLAEAEGLSPARHCWPAYQAITRIILS